MAFVNGARCAPYMAKAYNRLSAEKVRTAVPYRTTIYIERTLNIKHNTLYSEKTDSQKAIYFLKWATFVITSFWGLFGLFIIKEVWPITELSIAKAGTFGDSFGALTSLFTGLGLVGVITTIYLQHIEIKRNKEAFQQQQFEGIFFQLLRLHCDIIASMELNTNQAKGRQCFSYYIIELEGKMQSAFNNSPEKFDAFYDCFYNKHQATLGNYFRLLYNIVKLVKRTDGIDKYFYTNLVRAQLSSDELKLIFYNCLSTWGIEKFKPLIEEFALLKAIPVDGILDKFLEQYSPNAFGGDYPNSSCAKQKNDK